MVEENHNKAPIIDSEAITNIMNIVGVQSKEHRGIIGSVFNDIGQFTHDAVKQFAQNGGNNIGEQLGEFAKDKIDHLPIPDRQKEALNKEAEKILDAALDAAISHVTEQSKNVIYAIGTALKDTFVNLYKWAVGKQNKAEAKANIANAWHNVSQSIKNAFGISTDEPDKQADGGQRAAESESPNNESKLNTQALKQDSQKAQSEQPLPESAIPPAPPLPESAIPPAPPLPESAPPVLHSTSKSVSQSPREDFLAEIIKGKKLKSTGSHPKSPSTTRSDAPKKSLRELIAGIRSDINPGENERDSNGYESEFDSGYESEFDSESDSQPILPASQAQNNDPGSIPKSKKPSRQALFADINNLNQNKLRKTPPRRKSSSKKSPNFLDQLKAKSTGGSSFVQKHNATSNEGRNSGRGSGG